MKLFLVCYTVFLLFPHFTCKYTNNFIAFRSFVKPAAFDIIEKSNVSVQCVSDLKRYVTDFFNLQPWALKMFDATGKIAPGFAYGNNHMYGNYDECLSIKKNNIMGKYCSVYLHPKKDWTILYLENLIHFMEWPKINHLSEKYLYEHVPIFDICIPKSCSSDDINNIWKSINTTYEVPLSVKMLENECDFEGKIHQHFQTDFLVFLFFGFVLSVVIASTIYDIYLRNSGQESNILTLFSLYTNMNNLLSIDLKKDTLICLNGIKVISMIWILAGHMYFVKSFLNNNNAVLIATELKEGLQNILVLAIPYAVDGFFIMSGLLAVYVYLKRSETLRISLFSFYLHRFFRLFPALFASVLFHSTVFKYLPRGPNFPSIVKYISGNCRFGWWHALTFTVNWADSKNACLDQTWYLSIDTQLYILAPFLLFILRKYTKKAFIFMIIISIYSLIYIFHKVITHQLGFLLVFELRNIEIIYDSIFLRLPSWLLGAFYGYLIYFHKIKRYKISGKFNTILWIFSLTTMFCLLFYHNIYVTSDYSAVRSGFMHTAGRLCWCFSVCNIIYSLSTGHGRHINNFLGHPIFVVLAKLSYCVHLVQMWVIYWIQGYQREVRYFSNFQIFYEFWGDSVIILFAATILHLVFEMPFARLMKQRANARKHMKIKL